MNHLLLMACILTLSHTSTIFAQDISPVWTVSSLPYRVLVEVPPVDTGSRTSDALPASLKLDFNSSEFRSLHLPGEVDLDSIQVIRYDPATGKVLPTPIWPFSRSSGERASRFLDETLPWDFPVSDGPLTGDIKSTTFPRGAFLINVKGSGTHGLLTWDHQQEGKQSSFYAIYFNVLPKNAAHAIPRQGFVGDGSPRRDLQASSLSGSYYNRVAADDWDGDGLTDAIIGLGFGNVVLFRNEGDRKRPKFGQGQYLIDSEGQIIDAGGMASPAIADWDGDGVRDLIVGIEGDKSLVWYKNIGTNRKRSLSYRGYIKSEGQPLLIPAKPAPESPHYKRDYAPSVDVVDWDGDGDPDLLLGGYITGYIWFYENTGRESDGTPALVFRGPIQADGKPIDTIWGAHPCTVDLDGDGDLDLLSGSFGQAMGGGDSFNRFLYYYENVGTRKNPQLVERQIAYEGEPPKDILAQARPVDFNNDGLMDLYISTMRNFYLAQNVGTKSAPRWKIELQPSTWGLAELSATQILDWNNDGHADLITSPLDGDGVPQLSLNMGQGTQGVFGSPRPILPDRQKITHPAPYGDPWTFAYFYDFDGDGDFDILWTDGPGYAYLHRNKGNNKQPNYDTLGEKLCTQDGSPIKVGPPVVPIEKITDFTVMQGSRAGITAFDFDGDGKTDVALGDTYGDVFYYKNLGSNEKPVFSSATKLGNITNRALPLTYDWDKDGQTDLLGISWSGNMAWYRNLGPKANPQFAAPQKLELPPTVMYSPRLLISDWNGDGDDDFIVMSSYPWFCWLEGSYVQHGYAQGKILTVESKLE